MTTGLSIIPSCEGCGACCRHLVWPPFYSRWPAGTKGNDPSWERLLRERPDLVAEIEADSERRKAAGLNRDDYVAPCLWYEADSGKCRNYEFRPDICRDFEAGEDSCLEFRREHGIPGPA